MKGGSAFSTWEGASALFFISTTRLVRLVRLGKVHLGRALRIAKLYYRACFTIYYYCIIQICQNLKSVLLYFL